MSENELKDLFQRVTPKDKLELLERIPRFGTELTIWEKGTSDRETFTVLEYFPDKEMLTLETKASRIWFLNKSVLISFTYNNMQYFTTSKITKDKITSFYFISTKEDFYKSDKRKNIRVQSGLFNKLELTISGLNGKENPTLAKLIPEPLPLLDISTGGVSIDASKDQAEPLMKVQTIKNALLCLNNHKFTIPQINILYQRCYNEAKNAYQVGAQFVELPDEVERKIFVEVNNAIYRTIR